VQNVFCFLCQLGPATVTRPYITVTVPELWLVDRSCVWRDVIGAAPVWIFDFESYIHISAAVLEKEDEIIEKTNKSVV
jgi:hypothetical protein